MRSNVQRDQRSGSVGSFFRAHVTGLTSVTELKIKTGLHGCRVGVRGGNKAFDLIIKLFISSDGSDIVWKAIPQLCPTETETAF